MKPKWEERLEEQLIAKFKHKFVFLAIFFSLLLVIAICLVVFFGSDTYIFVIFILGMLTVVFLWGLYPMLRDMKSVKERIFEKSIAKVSRYEERWRRGGGGSKYFLPVLQDELTGEEIILNTQIEAQDAQNMHVAPSAAIGERYLLLYLKHSKTSVHIKYAYDDNE